MFASKDKPLRCSKLAAIAKCSIRVYMLELLEYEDEGKESAQTGSLVHAGVQAFHLTKGGLKLREKAAWDAIAATRSKFPLADETEVRLFITPYMSDMRNITAEFYMLPDPQYKGKATPPMVPAIEYPVSFQLPPHPFDKTGENIWIEGHLDQIRLTPQRIVNVDDLKTGKVSGWQMIHDYAVQIAAYTYGARELGIKDAQPGRIIRAMGYRTKTKTGSSPDGVFWSMPYTWKHVSTLLENIRLHVALVRNEDIQFNPGPHCTYCEFGGLSNCLPKWDEISKT